METFIPSSSKAVLVTHSHILCVQGAKRTNSSSLHSSLFSSGNFSIKPCVQVEFWLLAAVIAACCGFQVGMEEKLARLFWLLPPKPALGVAIGTCTNSIVQKWLENCPVVRTCIFLFPFLKLQERQHQKDFKWGIKIRAILHSKESGLGKTGFRDVEQAVSFGQGDIIFLVIKWQG